jgi:hypothetical protein
MNFQPDPVARFAQLESSGSTRKAEVPVPAPARTGEAALAPYDKPAAAAFRENLASRKCEFQLEHWAILSQADC